MVATKRRFPEVWRLRAGANEFEIRSIRDFVLAHGKGRDRDLVTPEFVVPSKLILTIGVLAWLTQGYRAARNFNHHMNGR